MRQLLHVILFNVNIFFAITFTFFGKKVSPMNPLEMSEEIQKFPERLKSAIGARSAALLLLNAACRLRQFISTWQGKLSQPGLP